MYIREVRIAGDTVVIRERMKKKVNKGQKRAPKQNVTSEKVWWNNLKYAIFKLTVILNANFRPGDHLLTLTYTTEPTREEAEKLLKKFHRAIRIKCKQQGIDFKRVTVTERKGVRLHHHIVCSKVPMEIIKQCWPHGMVFHRPLWDYPNYSRLAEYLLKQASALHMEDGDISKKRYTTSRKIIVPEGKEEEIKRGDLEDEPKAFKDYEIDRASVQIYENEITGTICREYIMVSTKKEPRLKKWYTGVTAKGERVNYSKKLREAYKEMQETFEDLISQGF